MVKAAPGTFVARHGPIGPIGGFLERFRRTGGVPAAVGGEATTELAVVFAALDEIEREVEELRERSQVAAARYVHEAEDEVEMILAEARARAESEREDAFLAGVRAADAEAARVVAAAEDAARRIRKTGEERLPGVVAAVLTRVFEVGS